MYVCYRLATLLTVGLEGPELVCVGVGVWVGGGVCGGWVGGWVCALSDYAEIRWSKSSTSPLPALSNFPNLCRT